MPHKFRRASWAAACLSVLLAGCYDFTRVVIPSDREEDPFEYFHKVDIQKVINNPIVFKNQDIRFELVYNSYGGDDIWLPFYTPFTPENFIPFSGWSLSAPIWESDVYSEPLRTLFIRRNKRGLDIWNWPGGERFSIIEVSGKVESTYHGIPWIKVSDITRVSDPVFTEQSLGALIRAMDLTAEGSPTAIDAIERVLKMPLSVAARREAHITIGTLYMKENNGPAAARHYESALNLVVDDRERVSIKTSLDRAQKLAKRQGITEDLTDPEPEPEPDPEPEPEPPPDENP